VFQWDNGFSPTGVWALDDRSANYSCAAGVVSESSAGFNFTGVQHEWVDDDTITYNSSYASANGFIGIAAETAPGGTIYGNNTQAISSGFWERDSVIKGTQSNGSAAGTMEYGLVTEAATLHADIGEFTLRDDTVDGATDGYLLNLAATWPTSFVEAPPLVAGNQLISVSTSNLPTIWVSESVDQGEAVSLVSGAGTLSASKLTSTIISDGLTDSITLPNGTRDGAIKSIRVQNTTSPSNGTLTPTSFCDGTSHTVTWSSSSATASFSMVWSVADACWWMLDQTNVVVN
jgi:hypothetical protein